MTFNYQAALKKGVNIIALEGELIERSQAKALIDHIDEIIQVGSPNIILDLTKLKYLNSSGLSVLINLFTKCRNAGGELIIANISAKVKELLVISKLNTIFTVKGSLTEAQEYFDLLKKA